MTREAFIFIVGPSRVDSWHGLSCILPDQATKEISLKSAGSYDVNLFGF